MPFTGTGTGIQNANDVFFSGLAQDNVLRYNNTTAKWNNLPLSVTTNDLAASSVTEPKLSIANSPASGNVLSWNGTSLQWVAPTSGSGQRDCLLIAASNAPASLKATADYVCDGTSDQVEINAALTSAAYTDNGGLNWAKVQLSGGTFSISSPIQMQTGTWLCGSGHLTILESSGAGMNGRGVIELKDKDVFLSSVSNLTLEGNYAAGGASHGIIYRNCDGAFLTAKPSGPPDPSGNYSLTPGNSPDSSHYITDIFVHAFSGTGTRHGIVMDADVKDPKLSRIRVKFASGSGVYINDSSDGKYVQIIVQGADQYGYYVDGASNMFANCKAAYCDIDGWVVTSSRTMMTGCAAQDNGRHGLRLQSASDTCINGFVSDANRRLDNAGYGVYVNSFNNSVFEGLHVSNRPQTISKQQIKGLYLNSANITDSLITGFVRVGTDTSGESPVQITGTVGTNCFARIVRENNGIYAAN